MCNLYKIIFPPCRTATGRVQVLKTFSATDPLTEFRTGFPKHDRVAIIDQVGCE